MKPGRAGLRTSLLSLAVLAAAVALWQAYVVLAEVPAFLLPAPDAVAVQLYEMLADGSLLEHSAVTAGSILLGFVLGSAFGFAGGWLLSRSRALEAAVFPYIMLVQATPKVALIPLFVIWFGLGLWSKLVLIVLSSFFPVMMNTIIGLRSTPREYYELMRILKASGRQTVFKVELPLAGPIILAGLKVAVVQSTIGAIVSEWVSGKDGLGYLLVFGSTQFDSKLLMASIAATTLLGLLFYWAVDFAEERLLFWHESKTGFGETV